MHMPHKNSSYCCLMIWLAIVLVCQSSLAQPNIGDWGNVEIMNPGETISVKTKSGATYHGEFVEASPATLSFDSDEPRFPGRIIRRRDVPREQVQEIRILHPGKSMLAGAAVGTGIGVGLGAAIESTAKSKEDNGILPVVFGLLGVALGIGIAHSHPFIKGKKIYVSPKASVVVPTSTSAQTSGATN